MNSYITIRIKKKYVMIISIILVLLCTGATYYFWNSYHPEIFVQVGPSNAGKENLKVEAPHISIAERTGSETAAAVELKIKEIWIQHELVCCDLKDNYDTSDIKLDMEIKKEQTILKYHGSVTTLNGEVKRYKKEVVLNFVLDAQIKKLS